MVAMRSLVFVVGLVVTIGLGGCSSANTGGSNGTASPNESAPSASSDVFGPHNAADATFASQLSQLNDQASTIADLISAKSDNPAILQAAHAYTTAVNDQSAQMREWLAAWGAKPDVAAPPPGILSDAAFDQLTVTTGAAFGQQVKSALATQIDGLHSIAQTELADGINPTARATAQALLDNATRDLTALQRK